MQSRRAITAWQGRQRFCKETSPLSGERIRKRFLNLTRSTKRAPAVTSIPEFVFFLGGSEIFFLASRQINKFPIGQEVNSLPILRCHFNLEFVVTLNCHAGCVSWYFGAGPFIQIIIDSWSNFNAFVCMFSLVWLWSLILLSVQHRSEWVSFL